jgi:SAM-dependent methyltransferase
MNQPRKVTYLTPATGVSMADQWFEMATPEHFWLRRRFDAFRRLAGDLVPKAREIAEIGCGNGVLQRQLEDKYHRDVAGFDLNEFALQRNVSRTSPLYCYDIAQRIAEFHERFDLIFLFDVLEHIEDEGPFLAALAFHLAPGGRVVVNVPAGPWAYSAYDKAIGHQRRYSARGLQRAAERSYFAVSQWTYWGLPLVPALFLRKLMLSRSRDNKKIISTGFDSRSPAFNKALLMLSACDPIPQRVLGASLMAVLQLSSRAGVAL